jgi:hypothetical protein
VQALQMSETKIHSGYFFCRNCKKIQRKMLATKCQNCDTRCNIWLFSALAGGFHDMSQEKTCMVSNRTHPVIVKEWLNDLLECLLTLLARGVSFSHGENSGEQRCTTDYLEAIHPGTRRTSGCSCLRGGDSTTSVACPARQWKFTLTHP